MVHAFVSPVTLVIAFTLPMAVLIWKLLRLQKAYKGAAIEPFTQLPLRPPGESLRLRIEELREKYDEQTTMLLVTALLAGLLIWGIPSAQRLFTGTVLFIGVTLYTIYSGKKVMRMARQMWDWKLGFAGERVVGEELNQLLARGFHVFHDVPFDTFNIDHVLVGAAGIYAVETKARRKPAHVKGSDKATVEALGDRLEFPNGDNTEAVPQARLNAKTLGEWLTKATGERVVASAIVTLPGWWVNRRQVHDVNVLNPQEIRHSFPRQPKYPLTPEQIQRIAHQLIERCRLKPEPRN
jgi:hypothetical protein